MRHRAACLTAVLISHLAGAPIALAQTAPPLKEPSLAAQLRLGRRLSAQNCGMCHAVDATGISPNPKAPPFRRLNEVIDVDRLGEGLATGILTGHPQMPVFRFQPNEVVAIIRFLRSIQIKDHA